jgi:phospholipid-binding lipoprotein MlaA
MNDFTRFALNSTLGMAGLFDIATPKPACKSTTKTSARPWAYWGVPSPVPT